jgi:hypothetical protein
MSLIPVQLVVLSSLVLAQYNTCGLMDVKIAAIWEPGNIGSDADWANAIAKGKDSCVVLMPPTKAQAGCDKTLEIHFTHRLCSLITR